MQIQAVRFGLLGKKQNRKPEEKKQGPLVPPPEEGLLWDEKEQKWRDPIDGSYWIDINDVPF